MDLERREVGKESLKEEERLVELGADAKGVGGVAVLPRDERKGGGAADTAVRGHQAELQAAAETRRLAGRQAARRAPPYGA